MKLLSEQHISTYIHSRLLQERLISIDVNIGGVDRPPNITYVSRQLPAVIPWWRHQMETFSTLLAFCAGNSPVIGEFHTQRPVTRGFGVFFDRHLNKQLSKQPWDWWFETPSCSLWRHCNARVPYIWCHGLCGHSFKPNFEKLDYLLHDNISHSYNFRWRKTHKVIVDRLEFI